ncbi:MAG: glycosyltransferase [Candidatus Saganbacteria bacterium]|nr:glycosyltransferase [Candidatus Saganbacteria bacterium]
MPKITVILTSYNKPGLVSQAIRSVLDQTCRDFELIVCDDNSNEQTKADIKPFFADPRVVYLQSDVKEEERREKCRYAHMINKALEIAKGEYISYLCDDDIYYPERLEVMAKALDEDPKKNIVYGKQKVVRLSGRILGVTTGIRETVGVTFEAGGNVDHNSIMHRKSCSDKVGGWDEGRQCWDNADEYFFKKLNKHWPFYPIEEVLDEHRLHKNSMQSIVAYEKRLSSRLLKWFTGLFSQIP